MSAVLRTFYITVFVVLVSLAGLLSTPDKTFATYGEYVYNPVSVNPTTPGAIADTTLNYFITGPNCVAGTANNDCQPNFSTIVFFSPPNTFVAQASDIPIGAIVGSLNSNPTSLGALGTPCDQLIPVLFNPMVNSSVDTRDVILSNPPGTSDRRAPLMADVNANGIMDGADKYPAFLNTYFDPDGPLGPKQPLQPRARYFGATPVLGETTTLQFVLFDPGAFSDPVTGYAGPNNYLAQIGPEMGYAAVVILNDDSVPPEPNAVKDFCAPLGTTTDLKGLTLDNPATVGIDESGYVRHRNPPAGTGVHGTETHLGTMITTGDRSSDNDLYENNLDTCPFKDNLAFNPRDSFPNANDNDVPSPPAGPKGDGLDDNFLACDPDPNDLDGGDYDSTLPGGPETPLFNNQQDNCPRVINPGQDDMQVTGGWASITSVQDPSEPYDGGSWGNGIGDACEATTADAINQDAVLGAIDGDYDLDGVLNATDNCTWRDNLAQTDTDGDGTGDACEEVAGAGTTADPDADTVTTAAGDNCPMRANLAQTDTDGDGIGDVCDPNPIVNEHGGISDFDRDGHLNAADNCAVATNIGQSDEDLDGIGNACDPSAYKAFSMGHYHATFYVDPMCIGGDDSGDGDGWCLATENALGSDPNNASSQPENYAIQYSFPIQEAGATPWGSNSTGVGGQSPSGGLGAQPCTNGQDDDVGGGTDGGDTGCSTPVADDADLDGLSDASDNCGATEAPPNGVFNPEQADLDLDGLGDACDPDDDNDGDSDSVERYVGSDPRVACKHLNVGSATVNHDAWAPDLDRNRFVGNLDFLPIVHPNTWMKDVNTPTYNRRADLDANGFVGNLDFLPIVQPTNWMQSCTGVAP